MWKFTVCCFLIFILHKAAGLALCISFFFLVSFRVCFYWLSCKQTYIMYQFLNLLYYIYQKAKIYLFFHACCITKHIIFKNFCLNISTAIDPSIIYMRVGGVKIFLYIYKWIVKVCKIVLQSSKTLYSLLVCWKYINQ